MTAIAPVAWGSNYVVAREVLPPGRPLLNAAARALPAGLLLLAVHREVPHGRWWWRAAVLGTLNVGVFFVLVYVAATRLASGTASTIMALAPAVMIALAWPLLHERPRVGAVLGAVVGVAGVALLVSASRGTVDPVGVLASLAAMLTSSVGFVIGKRWNPPVSMTTFTAWQLTAGGLVLLPVALVVDGVPPTVSAGQGWAYLYTCLISTALAYVVWLRGLQRLPAGTVALVGLLNPLTGTALGSVLGGEAFGVTQVVGTVVVLVGVCLGQPDLLMRFRAASTRRDVGAVMTKSACRARGPCSVSMACSSARIRRSWRVARSSR